jgi:hypothetical protein
VPKCSTYTRSKWIQGIIWRHAQRWHSKADQGDPLSSRQLMRQMSGLGMENPIFKTEAGLAYTAEELARLEKKNGTERSEGLETAGWRRWKLDNVCAMPKWYRITNLVRLELPPLRRNPPAYTSHGRLAQAIRTTSCWNHPRPRKRRQRDTIYRELDRDEYCCTKPHQPKQQGHEQSESTISSHRRSRSSRTSSSRPNESHSTGANNTDNSVVAKPQDHKSTCDIMQQGTRSRRHWAKPCKSTRKGRKHLAARDQISSSAE